MADLLQSSSATEERDSSFRVILLTVVIVLVLAVAAALLLRSKPTVASGPPTYASNLKFSDFKMSAAENFVGHTVSYIDGKVTNTGTRTVTSATVEVTFRDELGQVAQQEPVQLRALKTGGPYDEAVDFTASPLGPGQSDSFRLTFDSISAQWNHQYPEIRVTDVTVK